MARGESHACGAARRCQSIRSGESGARHQMNRGAQTETGAKRRAHRSMGWYFCVRLIYPHHERRASVGFRVFSRFVRCSGERLRIGDGGAGHMCARRLLQVFAHRFPSAHTQNTARRTSGRGPQRQFPLLVRDDCVIVRCHKLFLAARHLVALRRVFAFR